MRCGRFITSSALLARWLVPAGSKRVQCNGHKNGFRSHLTWFATPSIPGYRARVSFWFFRHSAARTASIAGIIFFIAHFGLAGGREARRREILCRRSALRAGGAGRCSSPSPLRPLLNPMHSPLAKQLIALSIRSFGDTPLGWRLSERAVRLACDCRDLPLRSRVVRTPGLGGRRGLADLFQPDGARAIAHRDAAIFSRLAFGLLAMAAFIHGFRKPQAAALVRAHPRLAGGLSIGLQWERTMFVLAVCQSSSLP